MKQPSVKEAKPEMFRRAFILKNPIQPYPWGSRTAIAELLGRPAPSPTPEAEIWMGAHPKAPSAIFFAGAWQPLDRLVERFPAAILGAGAAERFAGRFPFLLKVLAAAEPLSLQAHPDRAQAREGFARENRAGIPLAAPGRNYRDENPKPELICALTEFWALNGFCPAQRMSAGLEGLCPVTLRDERRLLEGPDPDGGIRALFLKVMTLDEDRRRAVIDEALSRARQRENRGDACRWVAALGRRYPNDIGLLAPVLLNLVRLRPGEAMFLPAGQLHAYLQGTGIEIMGNSDNVLRGGLTAKHVDTAELLRVLRFQGRLPEVLRAGPPPAGRFPAPAEAFALGVIPVAGGRTWHSPAKRGVEILLCTGGQGRLTVDGGASADFRQGTSLLVPAGAGAYRLDGRATVFRASGPDEDDP